MNKLPAGLQPAGTETRSLVLTGVQVRAASADGAMSFVGHASVFNERTWIGDPDKTYGFYEEIAPNAYRKTLAEADVRMLLDHDTSKVLARTKSGTLRLREDEIGLLVEADLAPTSYGKDLAVLLERGDVSGMSFGFIPVKEEVSRAEDGHYVRRITEIRLIEVSAVTFPAYPTTDAALRSAFLGTLTAALPEELRSDLTRALSARTVDDKTRTVLRAAADALASLAASEPEPVSADDDATPALDDDSEDDATTQNADTSSTASEPGSTTHNATEMRHLALRRLAALGH